MLRELHISNLAVIEDATVEFGVGFNVFTGQTGAGKSLILGAFELLLGLRSGSDMLRGGAEEGRVVGVFEVDDPKLADAVHAASDGAVAAGEEVLITRKLFASGRSSVSVNGQPTTAAMVKRLGTLLVDIHGQHDHQSLLRPASQLEILDDFGGCTALRQKFSQGHRALREMKRRRAELDASATLRRQQIELYEFQAREIDDAEPTEGEFPELQARHRVLSNARRLLADAGQVQSALYEADGSVIERLEMMTQVLRDLAEIDDELRGVAEQVEGATASAREASFDLSRYVDRLDFDEGELGEVESRLNTLNRLIQKYSDAPRGRGGLGEDAGPADDPLQGVLNYRADIQREIESLQQASHDFEQLDAEIAAAERELRAIGEKLSQQRREAAGRLIPAVEQQLPELGMADARLEVAFEPVDAWESTDGEADPHAMGCSTGLERVEWRVQTNPGQPMRPLRKIASGGELSRITLAIKHVLAASDRTSVLVFDEIDANIGGRLGSVIGRKLRELCASAPPAEMSAATGSKRKKKATTQPSKSPACKLGAEHTPRHQVLCITHLPQIAAFADRHFRIEKSVLGKGAARQTRTTVRPMAGKDRIDELAEMMAGREATDTTRRQAKELIAAAA
ncbi:MAG: DNA repair protein RecN [Phycisphaeraceae bacterium]